MADAEGPDLSEGFNQKSFPKNPIDRLDWGERFVAGILFHSRAYVDELNPSDSGLAYPPKYLECMNPEFFKSEPGEHPPYAIIVGAEPAQMRPSEFHLPMYTSYVQFTDQNGDIMVTVNGYGPKIVDDEANINRPGPHLRTWVASDDNPLEDDPMYKNDAHPTIPDTFEHGPGIPVYVDPNPTNPVGFYARLEQELMYATGASQIKVPFGISDNNGNTVSRDGLAVMGLHYPPQFANLLAPGAHKDDSLIETPQERGMTFPYLGKQLCDDNLSEKTLPELMASVDKLEKLALRQLQIIFEGDGKDIDADVPGPLSLSLPSEPLSDHATLYAKVGADNTGMNNTQ